MEKDILFLEKKHEGQRNEVTRLLAIVKTKLEESNLWLNAVESDTDYRRKALANTARETAELYLEKSKKLDSKI